jgi:prefoldin subunit 5
MNNDELKKLIEATKILRERMEVIQKKIDLIPIPENQAKASKETKFEDRPTKGAP